MTVGLSPLQARVAGVFVPVREIEKARDWYCRILGITAEVELQRKWCGSFSVEKRGGKIKREY